MAVGLWEASLAIHASHCGLPMESFLMLGRQSLALSPEILDHLDRTYEVRLKEVDWEGHEWAETLFQKIGAQDVFSLDYSDYEGAELIHDMNLPWPGGTPPRQFDVVFDGGTLEHVFNAPQALANAMSLVKVGGCLLSVTPVDGWLGHGFHQFQPEFFYRFLTPERGFRIRGLWLAEFGPSPAKSKIYCINDPAVTGCRPLVPARPPLVMLVFAEKVAEYAESIPWPSQSNYTAMWRQSAELDLSVKIGPIARLRGLLLACLPAPLLVSLRRWLLKRKHARLARGGWTEVTRLEVPVGVTGDKSPCHD